MNTKSKTGKTPTAAELSRLALADSQTQLAIRRDQHDRAETAAAELVARLANGDDGPTAVELGTVRHEVDRAALLVQAAEGAVTRAERGLINDDTLLAVLFADVLGENFGGLVPVKVTGLPTEAQPNGDGTPVVWIVQEKPTTKTGGIISGLLDIVFYRPHLFAPLNSGAVEAQCQQRGYAVQAHQVSQSPSGDGLRDSLRLRVHRASQPVPELAITPTDAAVHDFARDVNGTLMQAVSSTAKPMSYMGENTPGKPSAELVSSRVASSVPGDGDSVRVTVETTSKVKPSAGMPAQHANQRLRWAIDGQVERVAQGVGRVVSGEAVAIEMSEPSGPRSNDPWTVTARFVLTYRLA